MLKLTPEIELERRALVKAVVESVPNSGRVFEKPYEFTSKADFVARVMVQMDDDLNLEVQFCIIEFLGFEDLPQEGSAMCADDPPVRVVWSIHFFHEFISERPDGSSSHDVFTAMIINMRNKFLQTQDQGAYVERTPLSPQGFIILGEESRYFPGAYGHYIDLIVKDVLT